MTHRIDMLVWDNPLYFIHTGVTQKGQEGEPEALSLSLYADRNVSCIKI